MQARKDKIAKDIINAPNAIVKIQALSFRLTNNFILKKQALRRA